MKVTPIIVVMLFLIVSLACQKEKEEAETAVVGEHKVLAEEVIQTSSYTYVKAREGDQSYWMAVGKSDLKEGMTFYYLQGMEMKNFESKDLNRTFDSIIFVDKISDRPFNIPGMMGAQAAHGQIKGMTKEILSIKIPKGGISIGSLYADKAEFQDRIAIISGKVTKFNAGIMGRNWVHIQDGTETDGKYDLTITTNDNVNVGDIVTFSGKIALDKDFGAGYAYEVIMENANILN